MWIPTVPQTRDPFQLLPRLRFLWLSGWCNQLQNSSKKLLTFGNNVIRDVEPSIHEMLCSIASLLRQQAYIISSDHLLSFDISFLLHVQTNRALLSENDEIFCVVRWNRMLIPTTFMGVSGIGPMFYSYSASSMSFIKLRYSYTLVYKLYTCGSDYSRIPYRICIRLNISLFYYPSQRETLSCCYYL